MSERMPPMSGSPDSGESFDEIYRDHRWGGEDHAFYSGSGSHDSAIVTPYIEAVRGFLARFATPPTVVDLGCGDFNIGRQLRDLCGTYTACDVVPALIDHHRAALAHLDVDFRVHDLRRDLPPVCDVLMIRQVLQHLSNADIEAGLALLAGRCRFLVVTEHIPADDAFPPNADKASGTSIRLDTGSGVVLTEPPFNLPRHAEEVLCEVPEYGGLVRTIVYELTRSTDTTLQPADPLAAYRHETCVLITQHGTLVTVAPDGRSLAHAAGAADGRGPLVVQHRDGRWRVCSQFSRLSPGQSAALARIAIEPSASGPGVVLHDDSGYLSAEPAVATLVPRPAAAEWETFRLRPITGMDLGSVTGAVTPRWREAASIPPLLHQTYPTQSLPPLIAPSVQALRAANPDYAWRLWTDDEIPDFILDHYGRQILEAYLRIDPSYGAARADLFRYLCLYRLGGVYLDIKSGTAAPLRLLIRPDDRFLLSQWGDSERGAASWWGDHPELYNVPGGEFQQWFVIAAPGHPLLERVINRVLAQIETYDPRTTGVGKAGVLRLTGPIAYTLAILPGLAHTVHRRIDANRALIYSTISDHSVLFPKHYAAQDRPIVLPR